MKCYENTTANLTAIATVTAGSTVGFQADDTVVHPGYFSAYLSAAVPSANTESAGGGATWFKIWDWAPTYVPGTPPYDGLVFASMGVTQVTFVLPSAVPSGSSCLIVQ